MQVHTCDCDGEGRRGCCSGHIASALLDSHRYFHPRHVSKEGGVGGGCDMTPGKTIRKTRQEEHWIVANTGVSKKA